jgi:NADH:ubiquinone oxidoreductase subunit 4 (subunit M)
MYNRLMFGALNTTVITKFTDIEFGEYCILLVLIIAMLLLGMFPEVVILTIQPCVENILAASANI